MWCRTNLNVPHVYGTSSTSTTECAIVPASTFDCLRAQAYSDAPTVRVDGKGPVRDRRRCGPRDDPELTGLLLVLGHCSLRAYPPVGGSLPWFTAPADGRDRRSRPPRAASRGRPPRPAGAGI